MKKTMKTLSMLLSLLLLFSLMAVNASAVGEEAMPIWPEDMLFVDEPVADPSSMGETFTLFSAGGPGEEGTEVIEENPDPDFAKRGGEDPADTAPRCSVSLYYVDGDERKAVEDPSAMLLQNLMDPHMELMLTPSEGWYISGLALTDGGDAAPNKALMEKAHADPASTAVSLFFSELTAEKSNPNDPDQLDSRYYSGTGYTSRYVLKITCSRISKEDAEISFTSEGLDIPHPFEKTGTEYVTPGVLYSVPGLSYDAQVAIEEWKTEYDAAVVAVCPNGAKADIKNGTVLIYGDTQIVLQWTKKETQAETIVPVYNYTIPEFTITAASDAKTYDGTPLTNSGWSTGETVFPLYNEDGVWTLNVTVAGSVTEPGDNPTANVIQSFTLGYDPETEGLEPLTFSYADGMMDDALVGRVGLVNGTLTVTPRAVTVTPVSGSIETHGENVTAAEANIAGYPNGWTQIGLVEGQTLVGVTVEGSGTESFDTSVNAANARVVMLDENGSEIADVTRCYEVTAAEHGHIEITNLTPPSTAPEETTPPSTQPEETTPPSTQPEETTPPSTQPEETVPPSTPPEDTIPEETVPPTTEPTPTPTPTPTTYNLSITTSSQTWTYDGQPHSAGEYRCIGLAEGDRIVRVIFDAGSQITDVGTAFNRLAKVEIADATGGLVPDSKYLVYQNPGILTVVKRDLTIRGISGSLTTQGGEIVASTLKSPDGSFTSGYQAEGLLPGHSLSGSFVEGSGTTSFQTVINASKVSVKDAYGRDVTANYNIIPINGYITITVSSPQRNQVSLTVTAKDGSFTYDGQEHSQREYTVVGLVDGDQIDKVNFKPTSVITNAGTQMNEIQSVVIKSANGAAVDSGKYSIRYVPGTLTVSKFPLTLTAVSDEKVYDGKALNNKNVKASALANSSHKLSADYEVYDKNGNSIKNGPVDVGVYTKKVGNVKITAGSQDVTQNYEITTVDGTLTIRDSSGKTNPNAVTDTAYYGSTYTIRSSAPYIEFEYLMIDGQMVPGENFTVKEGSTIITLKASFIQSLKTGNHNYTIVSQSQQADGNFNVSRAPKTADKTKAIVWFALIVIALLLALATWFTLSRRPQKAKASGPQNGRKPAGTAAKASTQAGSRTGSRPSGSAPAKSGKSNSMMGPGKVVPPAKKKPVSDVVMDFGSILGEEAEDPTQELVKDFRINLDDYRAPEQAKELGLKMESRDSKAAVPAPEADAEAVKEVKLPPVRKEAPKAPVEETAAEEPVVRPAPKKESAEPGPASWYQAAEKKEENGDTYRPKH